MKAILFTGGLLFLLSGQVAQNRPILITICRVSLPN